MTTYYNYLGQAMAVSADPTTWVNGTSAGDETLRAVAGPSAVASQGGGNDLMIGAPGDVTFYAGSGTDTVQVASGQAGVKSIVAYAPYALPANVQNLQFMGSWGAGNDLGNLVVMGGNDANYMDGGAGNDVLVGGFGQNNFGVQAGNGSDVIYNFHVNQDTVRMPGTSFTSFAQIQAAMTQTGSDVVLKIDPTETLTFRNTHIADFTAKNFLMPLDTSKLGALTFDDEFNSLQLFNYSTGQGDWQTNLGGSPDRLDTYQIDGNQEKEVYTDASFRGTSDHDLGVNPFSINNGVLSITATKLTQPQSQYAWGQAYSSGMLTTKGIFMQQYGYFEMKAQLPTALGTWPAFWLSQDPYKTGVEADVLEHLALNSNVAFSRSNDAGTVTGQATYMEDPTGFHTYGMLWSPTTTTFYIDRVAVMQLPTPQSWDKPMYLLVNMAMGGWGGNIDDSALPAHMDVDYVRVYGLADNSQIVQHLTPAGPAGTLSASGSATTLANSSNWTDAKMLDNGEIVVTSAIATQWGGHSGQATLYNSLTGAENGSPVALYAFAGAGQTMDPVITTMDGSFWRVDYTGANAPQGWEVYDSNGTGIYYKNQYTSGDVGFTPLVSGSRVITNSTQTSFAVADSHNNYAWHNLPTINGVATQPSEVHALSNGGFFFTYAGQSQIDVFNGDGSVDKIGHLGAPTSSFTMASDAMTDGQFAVAWLAPPADGSFNMNLSFQTFNANGQALAQSQTVTVDADPWNTKLEVLATGKPGEALLLWSQGGAISTAFAHGSTIDAPVTLMAGSLDGTTTTALSNDSFLLTWMQNDNGVQDLWSESINPYTMQGTREQLGAADGDVHVVPLANGGYAVSWHLGSEIHARAYDGAGHIGAITTVAGDFIGADANDQIVSVYHDAHGAAVLQRYAMTDYNGL